MKKPTRADFGWTRQHGWNNREDIDRWSDALCAWENRGKVLPGRARSEERPIHPSWADYVAHFDSTNPERSQNAFCAWAGMRPSSLSAAKRKPITNRIELLISQWIEELEKLKPNER